MTFADAEAKWIELSASGYDAEVVTKGGAWHVRTHGKPTAERAARWQAGLGQFHANAAALAR